MTILDSSTHEQEFTAVSRVAEGEADRVTVRDSPFSARIEWKAPPAEWVHGDQVQEAIQDSIEHPLTGEAGTLAEVNAFLDGVTEAATHLGYAAVTPISIEVVVTCANLPRAVGTVHSWTVPNFGAVTCDSTLPQDDGGDLARRAQENYCA